MTELSEVFFYALDEADEDKVNTSIREVSEAAKENERLTKAIRELPDFTGDLKHDGEVISLLRDLILEGLALEERIITASLGAVRIQRQAYLKQQGEGQNTVLPPKHEHLFIQLKDAMAARYLESGTRELVELMKKLGLM